MRIWRASFTASSRWLSVPQRVFLWRGERPSCNIGPRTAAAVREGNGGKEFWAFVFGLFSITQLILAAPLSCACGCPCWQRMYFVDSTIPPTVAKQCNPRSPCPAPLGPSPSKELDTQRVLLPKDLRLSPLDQHPQRLLQQIRVHAVKLFVAVSHPPSFPGWNGRYIPAPLVASPSLSSYSVNTPPRCAVSSTHPSTNPAHSSGVRQYTHTTSPPPLPSTGSARPSRRRKSTTSRASARLRRRLRARLWKSSDVSWVVVVVERGSLVVVKGSEMAEERESLKSRWWRQ